MRPALVALVLCGAVTPAFAQEPTGFGGKLVHDKNDNNVVDPSEELGSVKIVIVDRATGKMPALVRNDEDGAFSFRNLPPGEYDIVVPGEWKFRDEGAGRITVNEGEFQDGQTFFLVPGPKVPDPDNPDIEVTASFEKSSYDIEEPITAIVKVKNIGVSAPSNFGPHLDNDSTLQHDRGQWGPTRSVATGEEHIYKITGKAGLSSNGEVRLKGRISAARDRNEKNNTFNITTKITHRTGDAIVTAFGDRNENGTFDQGEALPGAIVSLDGGVNWTHRTAKSDSNGRAAFADIPVGEYYVDAWTESGWTKPFADRPKLMVNADAETMGQVRLVPPFSDKVEVKVAFDQAAYPTEAKKVGLTVTLTNKADRVQNAIVKGCGSGYERPWVIYADESWGDIGYRGPGVNLVPGETRSFHFEHAMPEASPDYGLVEIECRFGAKAHDDGSTKVIAKTKVTGFVAASAGKLMHIRPGKNHPVANTKIVLLDPDTQQPVASSTTDTDGRFSFPELPVGQYTPVVVGKWKVLEQEELTFFHVVRNNRYPADIHVEEGPDVADPTQPAPAQPPAQARATAGGGLASTGASVLGIALAGLLLLGAGIATRTLTRRKSV